MIAHRGLGSAVRDRRYRASHSLISTGVIRFVTTDQRLKLAFSTDHDTEKAQRMNPKHSVRMLCAALLLTVIVGCGDNSMVPVSGKVTFADGKPLTKGRVNFQSDKNNAFGVIESDGSYELMSVEEGDGAPPGTYKVFISGAYEGEVDPHAPENIGKKVEAPTPLVAEEFETASSTPITVEVGGSDANYDIKVEPRK